MSERKFNNDKEELEFYREMKKSTNELVDEIHDLLDLDKEYPKRLYIQTIGRQELIFLKKAIKQKFVKKDVSETEAKE